MNKLFLILLVMLGASGCSQNRSIVITDLDLESSTYVDNQLKSDDYPGFMTGEGNIYSCRYGISYKRSKEFNPPKEDIFSALLKKNIPSIDSHQVILKRFDVYYNSRLQLLSLAGNAVIGGAIGSAITTSADNANYGFTHKNLLVDIIPDTYPLKTDENAVGCDGKNEGEYYASRITGGHNVVVTWLHFSVDDTVYHFRTLYQIQPESPKEVQDEIATAIEKSIEAISKKIEASIMTKESKFFIHKNPVFLSSHTRYHCLPYATSTDICRNG